VVRQKLKDDKEAYKFVNVFSSSRHNICRNVFAIDKNVLPMKIIKNNAAMI